MDCHRIAPRRRVLKAGFIECGARRSERPVAAIVLDSVAQRKADRLRIQIERPSLFSLP
jgi:hypothetical protein